jgi:hypothetical protein
MARFTFIGGMGACRIHPDTYVDNQKLELCLTNYWPKLL